MISQDLQSFLLGIFLAFEIIVVSFFVCTPAPAPCQYKFPSNLQSECKIDNMGLIAGDLLYYEPQVYRMTADSLFKLENPYNLQAVDGQVSCKRWRFIGLVVPADTEIVRYECTETSHYWR